MKKWLARLAFSSFIVAAVFGWEASKATTSRDRATIFFAIAIVLVGLGAIGVRERHRPHE